MRSLHRCAVPPRLQTFYFASVLHLEEVIWFHPKSLSLPGSVTPMEACSIARIMSLWRLATRPRSLCSLLLRALPKLLSISPSSWKVIKKDEYLHPEFVESKLLELPADILMDIFSLLQIPDLVRAGSVCSSWHSVYTELRMLDRYKRNQTPCLLFTSKSAGENVACLYSLEEKRAYRLTLPDPPIRTRYLIGSSNGWLVTADEISELHLVNPITGEQIALPSVITIEHVAPIFDDWGTISKYSYSRYDEEGCFGRPKIVALDMLRDYLYIKAFLFYDTLIEKYIVVFIHNPKRDLSFAWLGDDKWTLLPSRTEFVDCIYKDGLLFAVTVQGQILTFDLRGHTAIPKLIIDLAEDDIYETIYIVQSPCGNLLQVWRLTDESDDDDDADPAMYRSEHTKRVKTFEVDIPAQNLVKRNNLDGHLLFLGHNQSLCLSAEEYPILKANHAYFTDDDQYSGTLQGRNNQRDIGVLNLDNGTWEELVSPQLWSNWPPPMWITPDLKTLCLKSCV